MLTLPLMARKADTQSNVGPCRECRFHQFTNPMTPSEAYREQLRTGHVHNTTSVEVCTRFVDDVNGLPSDCRLQRTIHGDCRPEGLGFATKNG
jgi:hypothetical protein